MGNITQLNRNAYNRSGNLSMDKLVYGYNRDMQGHKLNNRLLTVDDTEDATENFGDWKATPAGRTVNVIKLRIKSK